MTDLPSSLNTHTAPSLNPIVNALTNGRHGQVLDAAASPIEEEEDYTIKCFCGFQVDDGNTVFCDRCDTWQHIECYYFEHYRNGIAPDVTSIEHACDDCSPRSYDKKSAIERQKDRFLPGERKVKKAPTKPIKRRAKLSESIAALANGYSNEGYEQSFAHDRTSGSPKDHGPPNKRPKTSHRNSGSINSHAGPFTSKPHSSRKISKNMTHRPPINEYFVEPPSSEFLRLYDDDPGDSPLSANTFNDIAITRSLSTWSSDVESLSSAANGLAPAQIFHRLGTPLDSVPLPQLRKEHRVERSIEIEGRNPQRIFLTTENEMAREQIIGELRGNIGHVQDYCQDDANRWDYLRHPAPFVFFHPKLPIYIDTRQAGSKCRYLRRSCRPNVELRTILENGSDYRFIFIAKDDLAPGAELTISWTTDEHIRRWMDQLSNPIKQEGTVDAGSAYVSDWVQKVLSNFGGCACESPEQCVLVKWLRPRDLPSHSNGNLPPENHSKGRNGHITANSVADLGNGTNSRASSESVKPTDDDDHNHSRSTSGSKTPTRHGSGVPSLEISDREKRKIAAAEKTFEQIEQERQQPAHKRKKRNSGGSNLNTPALATSVGTPSWIALAYSADLWGQKQVGNGMTSMSQPNTPSLSARPRYADSGTSRKRSGSPVAKSAYVAFERPNPNGKRSSYPTSPLTSSSSPKQNYVHSSVQTDAEKSSEWERPAASLSHKRRVYISLGKRLLMRCQQDRERVEEQRRVSVGKTSDALNVEGFNHQPTTEPIGDFVNGEANHVDTKTEVVEVKRPPSRDKVSPDLPVEKPRPPDKSLTGSEAMEHEIKAPPQPLPVAAITGSPKQMKPVNGFRSSELKVQLPPAHDVSHDPASAPPMAATTTPTIARSPFSHTPNSYPPLFSSSTSSVVAPSPVKKVSLGEYFSRRKTESQISTHEKAVGSSPMQGITKGLSHGDDISKQFHLEVNGIAVSAQADVESLISRKSSAP